VGFGPDVAVEENVTIDSNVVFEGENLIKAGSVIKQGVRVARGATVTGMVSSTVGTFPQMRGRAKMPHGGRPEPAINNYSKT
jgi:bifunctional N-acetylglucosamine-1-phosphate-uridyltransferase/glucosamine-1-phosphate-acetyltransferase GlmU-like protein